MFITLMSGPFIFVVFMGRGSTKPPTEHLKKKKIIVHPKGNFNA